MISARLFESFATRIATGATMIAESNSVEINAASVRRSPKACLSFENGGQLVKHKIAAHRAAEMNGRRIRRQPNASNETPATAIHLSIPARVGSPSFVWLLSALRLQS